MLMRYWQKNRQVPGLVLIAWTVARPAIPPVNRVRTTRPMNTRRRNFASAAIVVELIRNSTTLTHTYANHLPSSCFINVNGTFIKSVKIVVACCCLISTNLLRQSGCSQPTLGQRVWIDRKGKLVPTITACNFNA